MSTTLIKMPVDERAVEIAREFHDEYEQLAPIFQYETREASAVPFDEVPENNRSLMIAVVQRLLQRGVVK